MPELPEVETIRRDLERLLCGETIVSLDIPDRRLLSLADTSRWQHELVGRSLKHFVRHGKYLGLELDDARRLIFHLRMTGQLLVDAPVGEKRYRLQLTFADHRTLSFYDQRRFGEAWLTEAAAPWPAKLPLGPDALNEVTQDHFVRELKKRSTRIHALLLDQSFIAGVGNIYAQEALHKAGIRPSRSAKKIRKPEAELLYNELIKTLREAIVRRGSTARDYRDASGDEGSAQRHHLVYQKSGKPCVRCKKILKLSRVGGRAAVFCSGCQK